MTLFSMQVACGCGIEAPTGMDQLKCWDGEDSPAGFIKGRRYIWQCPNCGNQVCVNLNEMEVEE